jgi:hypothetical protein
VTEPEKQEAQDQTPLEALLAYLKRGRGFDFAGYKRTSLERRIRKRMDGVGVADYGEYLDYLEVHQDELSTLFDTILINVTGFFATRRPGTTTRPRSSRGSWRRSARTSPSACGAPAARPARRRTRWRWSSSRRSASTPTSGA